MFESEGNIFCLTVFWPVIRVLPCTFLEELSTDSYGRLPPDILTAEFFVFDGVANSKPRGKDFIKLHRPVTADSTFLWKSEKLQFLMQTLVGERTNDFSKELPCCLNHDLVKFNSWFLLMNVGLAKPERSHFTVTSLASNFTPSKLRKGTTVYSSTSPFGSFHTSIFGACVSKGIVCNIIDNIAVITDARCLPGSEGGALFYHNDDLLGLVISPITLDCGNQSGFAIVCSFYEIKDCYSAAIRLSRPYFAQDHFSKVTPAVVRTVKPPELGPPVVKVDSIKNWGSGVIVGIQFTSEKCDSARLLIATCKHVVAEGLSKCIMYREDGSKLVLRGKLLYKSACIWFDFALISTPCSLEVASEILASHRAWFSECGDASFALTMPQRCQKRDEVFVKAHTLYEGKQAPFLTKGVISNVVDSSTLSTGDTPARAVLIHTTCVILNGSSGGALISEKSRSLLGLVVCNVQEVNDHAGGSLLMYSDVSFALPAVLFMPAVHGLLSGADNWSQKLDAVSANKAAAKLWSFDKDVNAKL